MADIQNLGRWVDIANMGVVFALALSFIFGGASIYLSRKLNKAKDAQSAREKQTADVKIEEAREGAAKANKIAAEANEHAKKIELHAEELRKENLQLGLRLEEEKRARLEIERRLAPRFLTSTEEKLVSNAISPFAGHIISVTKLGEAEAGAYAVQIINILKASKWKVIENFVGIMSPPPYNVICEISARPDTAVQTLISAFQKAGVQIDLRQSQTASPETIKILVGLKLQK